MLTPSTDCQRGEALLGFAFSLSFAGAFFALTCAFFALAGAFFTLACAFFALAGAFFTLAGAFFAFAGAFFTLAGAFFAFAGACPCKQLPCLSWLSFQPFSLQLSFRSFVDLL
jgi:hypothetical protein